VRGAEGARSTSAAAGDAGWPANERDARSLAIAALRAPVARLHALLRALSPGGISKELYASNAERLLGTLRPATPVEHTRVAMANELLDDVRRLDDQLKVSHRRIKEAVTASGTTLTDLYGVGPVLAAMREAVRALKRQVSNAVYRQLLLDAR